MLRLVTPPTEPVLTLAEAKAHLRVDHDDDDALITGLIAAATTRLDGRDGILDRCLMEQTWELVLPRFPRGNAPIYLPLPPTIEVVSVQYLDPSGVGTLVEMDPDDLRIIEGGFTGAQVVPAPGEVWPATDDEPDSIRITFTAGYEDGTLPAAIKQAMLLLIGDWYENRGNTVVGTNAMPMPFAVDALLAPYRTVPIA